MMGNMVTDVCAKFSYDRFHIDKAVGNFRKSHKKHKHNNKPVGDWISAPIPNVVAIATRVSPTCKSLPQLPSHTCHKNFGE